MRTALFIAACLALGGCQTTSGGSADHTNLTCAETRAKARPLWAAELGFQKKQIRYFKRDTVLFRAGNESLTEAERAERSANIRKITGLLVHAQTINCEISSKALGLPSG